MQGSIITRFPRTSMSRVHFLLALVAALLLLAEVTDARQAKAPAKSRAQSAAPADAAPAFGPGGVPVVAATSWVLVDTLSGQTLGAVNADERRDPASLTKLMTAYRVFAALRARTITPSQMVNVSQRAWKAEGSRMFIEPRKAVSVDELLRGMIVQSGNDASIALAELVAGTEEQFVAQMNAEAARLGLANTRFVNVTGLSDPQHYSSAADMARLTAALIRDFPDYYPIYSEKEFRYNGITQSNRNRLLWTDPYVDGVKTGHTEAAGWCLIASAKRGERRLLSVVLGANSDSARAAESQKLLNWGFQAFDTVQLYQSGKPVATIRVWKGAEKEVDAGFLADRYLTLPKGKADKLALTMQTQEPLVAPVQSAQRVGVVKVALEGKPMAEFPLIALKEVPPASIVGRAWDTVRLWFVK
jgi:serine-type D-Ala-D-Ala carboxypeptidase (penicillin-binding protein 5/6)